MKNDAQRIDNPKAETVKSNKADTAFQYNLIKQKVRVTNSKDTFWIDAQAMLPALQDEDSQREKGSAVKPIEYSQNYLDWLIAEYVEANGIKEACDRILNKCYMIKFNEEISSLLKVEYQKLLTDKPNMPVSKFDVEKTVNESDLLQHYNKHHSFPASAKADSMLNSSKRKVEKANKQRVENGKAAWNEAEQEAIVQKFYKIELAKQAEQNLLLS